MSEKKNSRSVHIFRSVAKAVSVSWLYAGPKRVSMLDAEGAGWGCCLPEGSLSLMSEEREEEGETDGPSQQATS